jgi:hypothetical protein
MCLVVNEMGKLIHDLDARHTPQATQAINSIGPGLPFGLAAWVPQSHDAAFKRALTSLNHGDVRGFEIQGAKECSALGL